MKVFDFFDEADSNCRCPVIWRCVAPDVEPSPLSEAVTSSADERLAIARTLNRLNSTKGSTRRRIKWEKRATVTRYSDGTIPVVYFARDPQTAITECFHWASRRIKPPEGSYEITLKVFSVRFDGHLKDLEALTPPCMDLVHGTNYDCCNKVAELAYEDERLDGLNVRSARRLDGVNVPVFRETSVGEVIDDDICILHVEDNMLTCFLQRQQFEVVSEDVYSLIAKS